MAEVENQSPVRKCAGSTVSAAVTKSIRYRFEQVLHGFQDGQLLLTWPDGMTHVYGQRSDCAEHNADVVLRSYQPLRRLITDGQIGFAESYMRGEWDTENLANLFSLIMRNDQRIRPATQGARLFRLVNLWQHWTNRNSHSGSQRNIAFHYDLGNAFYRLWLDSTMSYSSALFKSDNESLSSAQQNKFDKISELLAMSSGSKVLDIGCGWGSLAHQLATDAGVDVTGVSLSSEQLEYAREHNFVDGSTGHSENCRTRFEYKDYRDVKGKFDHIVSIEMFEAVGERYWETYFDKLNELLESGGTAVVQSITIAEDRFNEYRSRPDFIQRYIFPGGMLPTKSLLLEHVERVGLKLEHSQWFGDSYARTLSLWRKQFEKMSKEVLSMNFDERFVRMWRYYLVYCETGFNIGRTNVGLLKLRKL